MFCYSVCHSSPKGLSQEPREWNQITQKEVREWERNASTVEPRGILHVRDLEKVQTSHQRDRKKTRDVPREKRFEEDRMPCRITGREALPICSEVTGNLRETISGQGEKHTKDFRRSFLFSSYRAPCLDLISRAMALSLLGWKVH